MVTSTGRSFNATSVIPISGYGSQNWNLNLLCQTGQRTRDQSGIPRGQDCWVTGDMERTRVISHLDRGMSHVLSWYVSLGVVTRLTFNSHTTGYLFFPGHAGHGMRSRAGLGRRVYRALHTT